MTAYYNENDKAAAAALRQLIEDDVIAPGIVDTRSIKDVQPNDLIGFTQCHLFAGGGLWSVAARLAGWPDDREIWTGSCPCQPFSAAGQRAGTDDPRHLWPDFFRLIRARRPVALVGEQVAGKAGYGWFDGVATDLESEDFACRPVDIPACAVDAPHIRNRLFWFAVANAQSQSGRAGLCQAGSIENRHVAADSDERVANPGYRHGGGLVAEQGPDRGSLFGPGDAARERGPAGVDLVDPGSQRLPPSERQALQRSGRRREGRAIEQSDGSFPNSTGVGQADAYQPFVSGQPSAGQQPIDEQDIGAGVRPGSRNGSFWCDAEWIACHDGKARRTKPGLPLLVDGFHGRVDLWRIAGNAISPVLAAEVIGAFMDVYG